MKLAVSTRTRVIAAAGVVAAMATVASTALFSDSGTVRSDFVAGTLDLKFDDGQDGAPEPYVISFDGADDLRPGAVVTQDLVVYNSGTVPATLALATPAIANAASGEVLLQDSLSMNIADSGTGQVLYSGPIDAAAFTGLDIGSRGSSDTGVTLSIVVTMDSAATIAVAGQSIQVDLPFEAVQAAA